MEPVTHILTGACLARTGLNRRAAYATLAMAVAAEFPDIDTLWSLRGAVAGFQHHRGITHTFLGIPMEAALIVGGVYLLHRWRTSRATKQPLQLAPGQTALFRPLTAAPVRWALLYVFTLLALLSHLWLDFTNNYGIRPFFPFNPRWYAASITFIFDPAIFLLLLAALILPPLFRLIGSEVGSRRQPFAPRGWAVAALLGVCGLWGWRFVEHGRAEQLALAQTYSLSGSTLSAPADSGKPLPNIPLTILRPQRTSISPDPISPFRWYSATDFGPLYQLGTVDLRAGTFVPQQAAEIKPPPSLALFAAERSTLGRAYLDWSPMPLIGVIAKSPASQDQGNLEDDPEVATVVTFRDPRFMGDMPWLRSSGQPPLTGVVELTAQRRVFREVMNGKAQESSREP